MSFYISTFYSLRTLFRKKREETNEMALLSVYPPLSVHLSVYPPLIVWGYEAYEITLLSLCVSTQSLGGL
jgi:hypothetical protein